VQKLHNSVVRIALAQAQPAHGTHLQTSLDGLLNCLQQFFIRGYFAADDFADWIIHRATRLSLGGWVRVHDDTLIEVYVSGDRVLVEAMEVACSLGPVEARVDSIESKDIAVSRSELLSRHPGQFNRYCL